MRFSARLLGRPTHKCATSELISALYKRTRSFYYTLRDERRKHLPSSFLFNFSPNKNEDLNNIVIKNIRKRAKRRPDNIKFSFFFFGLKASRLSLLLEWFSYLFLPSFLSELCRLDYPQVSVLLLILFGYFSII